MEPQKRRENASQRNSLEMQEKNRRPRFIQWSRRKKVLPANGKQMASLFWQMATDFYDAKLLLERAANGLATIPGDSKRINN